MRGIILAVAATALGTGQLAFAQNGATSQALPAFTQMREVETKFGVVVIPVQPVQYRAVPEAPAVIPQPVSANPNGQAARFDRAPAELPPLPAADPRGQSARLVSTPDASAISGTPYPSEKEQQQPNTSRPVIAEAAATNGCSAPSPDCTNCQRRKSCKSSCCRILEWLTFCPARNYACCGKTHLPICRPHGYEFFLRPCYGCTRPGCSCGYGAHAFPTAR